MSKLSDILREQKFIKNKEHLSKEDYERLAEIETELKEIMNEFEDIISRKAVINVINEDNNVPIKKTNFEKLIENDKDNLILAIATRICINTDKCKVDVINTMDYNDCGDCFHARNGDCTPELKKWLESEVKE